MLTCASRSWCMLVNEVLLAGSAGFRSLHGAAGQVTAAGHTVSIQEKGKQFY